jgi:large subunit ribosomal protein L4
MELELFDISGKKDSKKVKLEDSVFNIEPNTHAIYLDVKQYLANKRQGTAKSKERAEVAGSTRKIKKQKGTGTARAGSVKSPVFVGGGTIFGPRPRDYSFKLNKKLKKLARKSALSQKVKDNALIVLKDFKFDEVKTKNYLSILENLKVSNLKTLLVLPENDANVVLSARNIKNAKVVKAEDLNTYDIMNHGKIILAEGSLDKIVNTLN